jgi:hypothetical protein
MIIDYSLESQPYVEKGIPIYKTKRSVYHRIEKGIPIYNRWVELTSNMEVGDSVLFPKREKSRMAVKAMKALGFKYTGRTVPDGYRIWRIS